jgi:hypothetical protein
MAAIEAFDALKKALTTAHIL